jgi:hypothetical protein
MALTLARAAVAAFAAYAAIGVLFAIAFTIVGVARVDHEARSASVGFRVLIFPASAALWPILLLRWLRGGGEAPRERTAHRDHAQQVQR